MQKCLDPAKRFINLPVTIDCVAAPYAIVIAPFRQFPCLIPKLIDWRDGRPFFKPGETRKASTQYGRVISQSIIQPIAEYSRKHTFGRGKLLKRRIHASFHWALMKKVSAKRMNRADERALQLAQGCLEIMPCFVRRTCQLFLKPLPNSQLHLAGGCIRKCHRNDVLRPHSGSHRMNDSAH